MIDDWNVGGATRQSGGNWAGRFILPEDLAAWYVTNGRYLEQGQMATIGDALLKWDGAAFKIIDATFASTAEANAWMAKAGAPIATNSTATIAGTLVRYGGAGVGWVETEGEPQSFVVKEATEAALRAAIADAQASTAGRKNIILPVGVITITSPLPLGGGLSYTGVSWSGVDSALPGYGLLGTIIDGTDSSFNAFEYAAIDALVPNPINSQSGMDWSGGGVNSLCIRNADYGVKVGAKWVLGISGLRFDDIYTVDCNYGVWIENCPNVVVGFISPNRCRKTGFAIVSSSNGWNYGNCEIQQISGNGHRTEQEPGYPGVLVLSRGGNSHINDVRIGHVNYAFNRGTNQATGSATTTSGSSSIDIGALADKVGINHPVFFSANTAGFAVGRAYFVTSKAGTVVTVSLSWGGTDVVPTNSESCEVKTLGHIALAFVGIDGCSYTYCKAEIIDAEQCAIGLFSQMGKGGMFTYGCFDANDTSGIISFVGRDTNTISGAVSISFPQKFQSSDIGDHGLYFATGFLPKTQLNPTKGFIGAGIDFDSNTVESRERWFAPLTAFPSTFRDKQVIQYANPLSPSGYTLMQRRSGAWIPMSGEVIASESGMPLATLNSGALTTLPVFESAIIPLNLIPDGTEFYLEVFADITSASGQSGCLVGASLTGTAQPLAMNSGVFALYTSMTPTASGNLAWPAAVRAKLKRVANKIVGINGASAATQTLNSKFGVEISTIGEGITRFVLQATRSNAADIVRLISYKITIY